MRGFARKMQDHDLFRKNFYWDLFLSSTFSIVAFSHDDNLCKSLNTINCFSGPHGFPRELQLAVGSGLIREWGHDVIVTK